MQMEKLIKISFRASYKEYEKLKENAQKTGLSLSSYIRTTALNLVPREKPDDEFYDVMKYLRIASNNLNQIAVKANTYNYIDASKMNSLAKELEEFMMDIRTKYLGSG